MFDAARTILQHHVDDRILPGASFAVLHGQAVVGQGCVGWADREAGIPLRPDHLFRVYSNTKLVTACAALLLHEEGRFGLDDPVADYLPALARLRVLAPDATTVEDAVPAREPIRMRHLFTHTAGFTYAFLAPQSSLGQAYTARRVHDPRLTLAEMVDVLAGLPLLAEPGSAWNYSVATDVLARVLEVLEGRPLDAVFARRVFEPLDLRETWFVVPAEEQHRLALTYRADPPGPQQPALVRGEALPYPGANLQPVPRLNGGGGLVSSLGDTVRLLQALLPGGPPLLRADSLQLLVTDQLPPGCTRGLLGGHGFGFGGAVTAPGEVQWGGLAGTHWCLQHGRGRAMALMTQRADGFWNPFWFAFKQAVDAALG